MPFDRLYTTFYWSAIVSITLKSGLGMVSYSFSIVTMAPSCLISEIKRDIGQKITIFSYPLAFDATIKEGVSVGILPYRLVWKNESGVAGYPRVKPV